MSFSQFSRKILDEEKLTRRLIRLSVDAKSTNRLDKIYGLLGLQDPSTDDGDILYLQAKSRAKSPMSAKNNRQLSTDLRGRIQGPTVRNFLTSQDESRNENIRIERVRTGRVEEWENFYLGRAAAPRNFPRNNGIKADYSKSVLELWKEVMSWPNLWDDFQLLNFSQLVQEVLGGVSMDYDQFHEADATMAAELDTSASKKSNISNQEAQPSLKFLGKQKAGKQESLIEEGIQRLYYTGGICRSAILFLGPPFTSLEASFKLIRGWIKLYFHPTKKLENTGELPGGLTFGITQAQSDLFKIVPIDSPRSYATFGGWPYTRIQDQHKKLHITKAADVSSKLSSLELTDEDDVVRLNLENISSSKTSSSETPSKQPRWFISDRGQIGLAPYTAQEGDSICQFKNCDVVALNRKLGRTEEKGTLVGRAILMQRWDEKLDDFATNRVRYSVPDDRCWENRDRRGLWEQHVAEQELISQYVDIAALWALTR